MPARAMTSSESVTSLDSWTLRVADAILSSLIFRIGAKLTNIALGACRD
jgi:hypothetical protein